MAKTLNDRDSKKIRNSFLFGTLVLSLGLIVLDKATNLPAQIHGEEMPGLAKLKAGSKKIEIHYAPLPDGAEIRFATKDPNMVMALHHWFDAQLSDHGHHASSHQ